MNKKNRVQDKQFFWSTIDSKINVFTIGALFFHIFGCYPVEVIEKMYKENRFIPLEKDAWELSSTLYEVTLKAVKHNPNERYSSVIAFRNVWTNNIPLIF